MEGSMHGFQTLLFADEYAHQGTMSDIPATRNAHQVLLAFIFVHKDAHHVSMTRILVQRYGHQGFQKRPLVREDVSLGFQSLFWEPSKKHLGRQMFLLIGNKSFVNPRV